MVSGRVIELVDGKKECTKCNEFKVLDDFYNKVTGPFGKTNKCIECLKQEKKYNHVPKVREDKSLLTEKVCAKCKVLKPRSEFRSEKRNANGMSSRCRDCMMEDAAAKRPEREKTEYELLLEKGLKKCTNCNEVKTLDSYYLRSAIPAGVQSSCRECVDSKAKEWALQNPEKWTNRCRTKNSNRRAAKANIPSTFPNNWWMLLLEFYGPYCMYPNCDKEINDVNNLTQDHIIPVSDTERSSDSMLNSQILCRSHNSSKNAYHETDYRDWTKGILLDDLTIIYDKIEPTSENLFKLQEKNETVSSA